MKVRGRGKKGERGQFWHVWPWSQLWFYEMRAEARAQVDNTKLSVKVTHGSRHISDVETERSKGLQTQFSSYHHHLSCDDLFDREPQWCSIKYVSLGTEFEWFIFEFEYLKVINYVKKWIWITSLFEFTLFNLSICIEKSWIAFEIEFISFEVNSNELETECNIMKLNSVDLKLYVTLTGNSALYILPHSVLTIQI